MGILSLPNNGPFQGREPLSRSTDEEEMDVNSTGLPFREKRDGIPKNYYVWRIHKLELRKGGGM